MLLSGEASQPHAQSCRLFGASPGGRSTSQPATPSARLDRFRSLIRRSIMSRAMCRQDLVSPHIMLDASLRSSCDGASGEYALHPSAILRDGEDSILYVDKARIHPQWPRKPCMLSWRDVRRGGGVLMDESRKEGRALGCETGTMYVKTCQLPAAYAGAHDKSVRYRYMYRRQVHVYLLLLCLVLRRASCTAD